MAADIRYHLGETVEMWERRKLAEFFTALARHDAARQERFRAMSPEQVAREAEYERAELRRWWLEGEAMNAKIALAYPCA